MMARKLILTMPIIAVLLLSGVSIRANALSSQDRYNAGWSDGEQNGYDAWRLGYSYDPLPCGGHTHAYCQGYQAGYDDYWHRAQLANSNVDNNNNKAENNANVKINGNNNMVEINQNNGQANGSPKNSNGDGY